MFRNHKLALLPNVFVVLRTQLLIWSQIFIRKLFFVSHIQIFRFLHPLYFLNHFFWLNPHFLDIEKHAFICFRICIWLLYRNRWFKFLGRAILICYDPWLVWVLLLGSYRFSYSLSDLLWRFTRRLVLLELIYLLLYTVSGSVFDLPWDHFRTHIFIFSQLYRYGE